MSKEKSKKKEMVFNGIPAAPGIAFGEAFVVNVEEIPVFTDFMHQFLQVKETWGIRIH